MSPLGHGHGCAVPGPDVGRDRALAIGPPIERLERAESETTNIIPRLERGLVLCAVCEMGPGGSRERARARA